MYISLNVFCLSLCSLDFMSPAPAAVSAAEHTLHIPQLSTNPTKLEPCLLEGVQGPTCPQLGHGRMDGPCPCTVLDKLAS